MIRVLIADDHAIVREGLRLILASSGDVAVVGEARNGREALQLAEELRPDILLMDISMPEMNGIEATKIIHSSMPSIKVIILSMHNSSEFVIRAIKEGARGYVVKDSAGTEVLSAIHAVMNGRKFISNELEHLSTEFSRVPGKADRHPLSMLSKRERETLQLVAEGKTNAAIAKIFGISTKSVETYRSRLMLKLGINNVPALVKFALQHGIISIQ